MVRFNGPYFCQIQGFVQDMDEVIPVPFRFGVRTNSQQQALWSLRIGLIIVVHNSGDFFLVWDDFSPFIDNDSYFSITVAGELSMIKEC